MLPSNSKEKYYFSGPDADIHVRVSERLKKAATIRAQSEGRSLSNWAAKTMIHALEKEPEKS